jgi:hypothetical protein
MNQEPIFQQSNSEHGREGIPGSSPSLPDLNTETYPFEVVQHLLDQAAYFNIFSIPDSQYTSTAIHALNKAGGVIGIEINEILHRFEVIVQPPTLERGLRAVDVVGESAGTFNHRWLVIPQDFRAVPDREPPPTLLDPSRSQRFVMLDGICRFGDGKDGFYGFGTGLTYPVTVEGRRQLLAAAVGTIMEGFGKFKSHEGTYTYCGTLTTDRGFQGNLLFRVMDPEATLRTEREIPRVEPIPDPEPGVTYMVLRGQKKDRTQKTTYSFGPDGQVNGLNVEQQLRLLHIDFATRERGGLRSVKSVGQVIGKMTSKVFFNILNPGAPGTAIDPIPFRACNEYAFFDGTGQIVGSLTAAVGEGRTFNMKLSGAQGQAALRFGGFGPILQTTGVFKGIEGLVIDNSVVGVAPHVISGLYMFRISDPQGKYSTAINEALC